LRSTPEIGQYPKPLFSLKPIMPTKLTAAQQLLVVVAADWAASGAHLHRFQRACATASWGLTGRPLEVSLGRSGLAWAQDFATPGMTQGPVKREGDGCSPAGVFPVTALFGTSAPCEGAKLPWLQVTPDLKCVDDPASRHYNRIVDRKGVDRIDWTSCENMLRDDRRYELGAFVGCNVDPVVPEAGSCIFLHVWAAPGVPTAGCTAMALADMSAIAGWLDGAAAPLLVQLPQSEYEVLRAPWGLPRFNP
jgi:L,D-peptidoglycan transpeptidase YkuD (ErfK/YbiS/YcfS/YnhG family)